MVEPGVAGAGLNSRSVQVLRLPTGWSVFSGVPTGMISNHIASRLLSLDPLRQIGITIWLLDFVLSLSHSLYLFLGFATFPQIINGRPTSKMSS